MQYILLLTFAASVLSQSNLRGNVGSVDGDHVFEWKEFTNFQERFSKKYSTLQEMEERLDQYFAVLDRPNRLEDERCPVTNKSKPWQI